MDPQLLEELRVVFDEEVTMQRNALAGLLVTLERDTSSPQELDVATREAFRIAHALKGAARAVGAEELVLLTHGVEDRLLGVRRGESVPRSDAISAVAHLLDGLPGETPSPPGDESESQGQDVIIPVSWQELRRMRDEARELRAQLLLSNPDTDADGARVGVARERVVASAATLSEGLQRLYAQPVDEFVDRLERNALEIARVSGKRVRFTVEGGALRFDRGLLQRVFEALVHLVSNAVDHGLESPQERVAAGKSSYGNVALRVRLAGTFASFSVEDDGRGIDLEALRRLAPHAAEPAFEPGITTSTSATHISGRGMGMGFVRQCVDELGGTIEIRTDSGPGTVIELRIPLLEGGVSAVLVALESTTYAIPLESVERVVRLDASSFVSDSGTPCCVIDDRSYRVVRLHRLLSGDRAGDLLDTRCVGVILRTREPLVILVPRVLQLAEIVARPLRGHLRGLPLISSTFRRPTGAVGLVLDMSAIVRQVEDGRADESEFVFDKPRTSILVVDDSVTTRLLVRHVLESEGYSVETTNGGEPAWQRLQEREYAAVVSDLDMPGVDGFELLSRCRAHKKLAEIPFVVLTGREDHSARERCTQLGATAFVEKGTFETTELADVLRTSVGASK